MFEKQAVFLEKYAAGLKGDVNIWPEESHYHIDKIEQLYHQRMEIQEQKLENIFQTRMQKMLALANKSTTI